MPQTTVQKSAAVRFGSAKLELGVDIGSLVNFGALREVKATEQWEETEVKSDNAGILKRAIRNQKLQVTAGWLEWDTERANTLRGGIDNYATQAASPVAITDEQVVLPGTTLKALAYKNADGTQVASIVVTHLSGTPTYVVGTDYYVGVTADGYTRIARKVGGAITDGQTVLVDYSYTPATSKSLKSGGKYTINPRVIRITNLNEAGKKFEITVYRAFNQAPLEIPFPSDDGEDAMVVPLGVIAELDTTRTAGDQLYAIVDEQSVT